MFFNFDPYKFAGQLCPPVLRSGFLMAVLRALSLPFRYIGDMINGYRQEVKDAVLTTSNVIVLEGALNDAFYLADRQIYITTKEDLGEVYFYRSNEDKITYIHTRDERNPLKLLMKESGSPGPSFTVNVPNFLATSLIYDEDKFLGKNLAVIVKIIKQCKPVGKSYTINLYEYE